MCCLRAPAPWSIRQPDGRTDSGAPWGRSTGSSGSAWTRPRSTVPSHPSAVDPFGHTFCCSERVSGTGQPDPGRTPARSCSRADTVLARINSCDVALVSTLGEEEPPSSCNNPSRLGRRQHQDRPRTSPRRHHGKHRRPPSGDQGQKPRHPVCLHPVFSAWVLQTQSSSSKKANCRRRSALPRAPPSTPDNSPSSLGSPVGRAPAADGRASASAGRRTSIASIPRRAVRNAGPLHATAHWPLHFPNWSRSQPTFCTSLRNASCKSSSGIGCPRRDTTRRT